MSPVSFDNTTESGTVSLGPSKNNPNPQVVIQNYNGRNWLTLENTLALPILVCPIQSGSGIITTPSAGLQIPPFTRCTIPIDSTSDVLLNCLGSNQRYDMTQWDGVNTFSDMQQGTFAQKQIQYMLHDNGNMFQSNLYPNLIPVGGQFTGPAANTSTVYYVAPNQSAVSVNEQWIWPQGKGVSDATIMAITVKLALYGDDPGNVNIRPCYDYDTTVNRHTSFGGPVNPFFAEPQIMSMKCPGAIGFAIQNFSATKGLDIFINAWLAIPGQ